MNPMVVLLLLVSLLFGGCTLEWGDDTTPLQEAVIYCQEQNGIVITSDENGTLLCQYQEEVQLDDGVETFTTSCDLMAFYEGRCDEAAQLERKPPVLIQETYSSVPLRIMLHDRVEDILTHLDNTGYAHNRNDNFSLVPDVGGVADSYNLFLDCSGFVGYYVLQGIIPDLYNNLEANSTYSCSRPLAADFAAVFKAAGNTFVEATEDDIGSDNVCWGQVTNLKDARPGDIIVYIHPENFSKNEKETCKDLREVTLADCNKCDYKDESRRIAGKSVDCKLRDDTDVICVARKNTGHVLYVHGTPYRSKNCKDRGDSCYVSEDKAESAPGNFQWVVKVADSTTAPHMWDSRAAGDDNSIYVGEDLSENRYHAWTKKYNGQSDLYRCNDGSYHRDCTNYDGAAEKIEINTIKETSPTGIGAGYIYVNDARDGFRNKYNAKTETADIRIGRPVKCGAGP